jgi:hypothetical protein
MKIYERRMSRYQNAKVYKLVNDTDDEFYIGSTSMSLAKRKSSHKAMAKIQVNRRVYAHLNEVGWEHVRIVLVEAYPCENKQELLRREQHWMDELSPSLNKIAAIDIMCEHGQKKSQCKDCGGSQFCEHERIRYKCKDCKGSQICEHQRIKHRCKDCGGSQICEHERIKGNCKDCGGSQFCEHGRRRFQCKDCGGSSICVHKKMRSHCKDCGGSQICEHRMQRNLCKDCGGSSICVHKKIRSHCKDCSPFFCDYCQQTYAKAAIRVHYKSKKHKTAYKLAYIDAFDEEPAVYPTTLVH